jgi:Ca2+-binding RTX toxin-like protein
MMTSFTPIAALPALVTPPQADGDHGFGKLVAVETDNMQTWGSDNADTINGGPSDNSIYGHGGNDFINGGRGNDYLDGDTGNDVIRGGVGDDSITGFTGSDVLYGENGADDISDLIILADNETIRVDGGSSGIFSEDQDRLFLDINGTGSFVIDEQGNSGVFDFKYASGQGSRSGTSIGTVEGIENLKINNAVVDIQDGQTFRVN